MDESQPLLPEEEQAFFQAIYQSSNLGICVTNDKGCFVLVNDAYCDLYGYDRSELIGRPFTVVLPPVRHDFAMQLHDNFIHGAPESSGEWRVQHKDGSSLEVMITSTRVVLSDERRFKVTTVLDITERKHNEQLLLSRQKQVERLSEIASQTINGVIILDKTGRVERVNDSFTRICGYTIDQVVGRRPGDLLHGPETNPETVAHMRERLAAEEGFQAEILNYHKSGTPQWMHISCSPLRNKQNELQGFMVLQTDITEQKRAVRLLAEERTLSQAIVDTTIDGLITLDGQGIILSFNKSAERMFQYRANEVLGSHVRCLMPERYVKAHDSHFEEYVRTGISRVVGSSLQVDGKRKDGSEFPLDLAVNLTEQNDQPIFVGSLRDITERRAYEDQIEQLAFHDPLTQLANRRLLENRLQYAMAATGRSGKHGALLFLDLDNFKAINDTLGHHQGDRLLVELARALEDSVYETDTLARLGGDEFVVVLTDLPAEALTAAQQVEQVAARLLTKLARPFGNSEFQHQVTCSIGAVLFSGETVSADELMRHSDMAMYSAKSAGRNHFRFFDPMMQAALVTIHRTESELRRAIRDGHLELYYQAQTDSQGELTGAEVLVRWNHPERGLLLPSAFIPMAEASGLIVPLGLQVLYLACSQLVEWSTLAATRHLTVSVNISTRQIEQDDFTAQVMSVVQQTGANPRLLKLEITESTLAKDVTAMSAKMLELKEHGIGFSLDDFGTGYSSLAYLKRLPIGQLKIDQSFVRDLLTDEEDRAIVEIIIGLANTLGIDVIAEGVETDAHRTVLMSLGCRSYQGYFFGRPEPLEQFNLRLSSA